CVWEIVDPQVADRLDQVERLPRDCLEPWPWHGLQILGRKAPNVVEERSEPRVVSPARGIVAVSQGGDTPRREQHPRGWARCNGNEPVDYAVLILRQEPLERVAQPEGPDDLGHQAGRTVRHPGTQGPSRASVAGR